MDRPTETSPPPVVCTLTTKELATQALEWTDLSPITRSREPLPNGARTTYDLEHADAIEELTHRELDCCGSWLGIETMRSNVLTLTITTENPEGVALIRTLAGLDEQ